MLTTPPTSDAQRRFRTVLHRQLLAAVAIVAGASALMFALLPGPLPWHARLTILMADLLLAIGSVALRQDATPEQRARLFPLVAWASVLITGLAAYYTGEGLLSPAFGFLALLVCALRIASGVRASVVALLLGVAVDLAFVAAQMTGVWEPDWRGGPWPVSRFVVTHGMVLAAALAAGHALSTALDRTLQATDERQKRFAGLLAIAADAYWELDSQGRLARFNAKDELRSFTGLDQLTAGGGLGQPLWALAGVRFEPEVLALLQAEIAGRRAVRDLPLRWADVRGRVRHFMMSAEPRVSDSGKFAGWWGVMRDVTTDVQAREALRLTETRYRDLFGRIPTPLLLHREARVLDANPAAVALFGAAALRELLGTDLVLRFEAGQQRERALARLQRLEALPVGGSLAEEEFVLQPQPGRRVIVRLSSVRVDVDGEAATLSIIIDETERRAAEELVRRSEALLSHLVATSPDAIVVNEQPGGLYTMVNPTFLALTGHASEDVIGRTSLELGIWPDPDRRAAFLQLMDSRRSVQNLPAELLTRDRRPLRVLMSAARFSIDGIEYQMTSMRDITAIEQTRREHDAILENALVGIAVTREGRFQMSNPRFDDMFGWTRGSLLGQSGRCVWPSDEAHAELGLQVGPVLARGDQVDIVCQMARRDGSVFACRLLAKALDPAQPQRGGTLWMAEDITERRAVEQALARARDEAEAANRAKSAFLANTSHEIRTPLNALLGLAQLARTPEVDDARRLQHLEQICESAETLSAILSDILDLSKIEAGRLTVEHAAFDLHALLHALSQAYGAIADARGLALHLAIEPDVPAVVVGDQIRLRQILVNYLTNALKFTSRGHIGLSVHRIGGQQLRFEVLDTGEGMQAASLKLLFQPFSQVDTSTTRRVGGTGLGLSICAELARLLDGRVGVQSEPGAGSVFWVELPFETASGDELESRISSHGADALKGARVLMVEDNPVNMMIAVAMLERWGVHVDQAADGEAALAAVAQAAETGEPFHAVLMDVQMPGMSGHEVTRRLRRRWSRQQLPVVALTAAALVSEREDALAAGMNDFLTKPIDANRLRMSLERLLADEA